MIVLLFLLVLGPLLLHALSTGTALLSNYNTARKIGLPIFILPISPENALWLIVGRHVAPWLKHLPFGGESISKVGYSGWEWVQKFSIHLEYGDAFVLVTPGKNWLYTCNGETLHDIFQRERRGDFERPVEIWGTSLHQRTMFTTLISEQLCLRASGQMLQLYEIHIPDIHRYLQTNRHWERTGRGTARLQLPLSPRRRTGWSGQKPFLKLSRCCNTGNASDMFAVLLMTAETSRSTCW